MSMPLFSDAMQTLAEAFDASHQWIFEQTIQPLLYALGWMDLAEPLFDLSVWIVIGTVEVLVLALVFTFLERRWPAEPVTDRAAVRTDILYTLLHRLGAFAMLVFVLLQPLVDALETLLRDSGFSRMNLDQLWPGFMERVLVSPSFHRRHHALGVGHEGPYQGVNFAVLFPIWDQFFRTADWRPGFVPTGIRDQLEGRDYGRGFWAQQTRALARWFGKA
jgi:sterol desaturase/sphingolipid hydroxylase (fatty acid hydroxylase superfamily)